MSDPVIVVILDNNNKPTKSSMDSRIDEIIDIDLCDNSQKPKNMTEIVNDMKRSVFGEF